MQKISVVFPVFNEETNLESLYAQVRDACLKAGCDYEMVFVDNGSNDGSLNIIKKLRESDKNINYVSLSRNFGHQNAIFAGMSHAKGDAVITMDADLQHPPSLIPAMVELWRGGAQLVYTTKENHPDLGAIKFALAKFFYWLISKISSLRLSFGQSDFRLLDRKVLNVILSMPEYHKFLRGQVNWVGFKQCGLSYKVGKRLSGKSKFSFRNLFTFALNGIFAFSRTPLHLIMLMGLGISFLSLVYILFVMFVWILNVFSVAHSLTMPPGWATLTVSIFFLGSIQLIAIGILGEYVGRIFDQTKARPVFIVNESSSQKG